MLKPTGVAGTYASPQNLSFI